jgi:ribosomal protein S18 acetylase RimI-like enzyme
MSGFADDAGRPTPPPGVKVVRGGTADIDRLGPLWTQLHGIHQAVGPELAPYVDDETSWRRRREVYRHCLQSPDAFLLLVERDERLVGYVMVAVEPDGARLWSDSWVVGERVAELETIVLLPEERGTGLGSYLLDLVDAELAERGIDDMVIGAVPGNERALDLYRRRGFEPTWVIVTRFAARHAGRGGEAGEAPPGD